jgi:hypothetical protein
VSAEEQEAIGRDMGELNVTDLKNPHFRRAICCVVRFTWILIPVKIYAVTKLPGN